MNVLGFVVFWNLLRTKIRLELLRLTGYGSARERG